MSQKTFLALIVFGFVAVTLAVLLVTLNKDGNVTVTPLEPIVEELLLQDGRERSVTAKHQFKDGTHTIAGELNLPTPCHILDTRAVIRASFPEQVVVEFSVRSKDAELCAQVITPARFKILFDALENVIITATINSEPVILNLFKVGDEEDLVDFELFIKE